ncbi:MAG: hypothetical protein ACPL1G_07900 [Thermodesulfovibrionales bacterium]
MFKISEIIKSIQDITERYGLKILYLDFTDVTLISRIGFSYKIFMQIYVNVKKEKLNMALIVAGERIYGMDKEGGFYHEHPFENPSLHISSKPLDIEDFVIQSIEILKMMNLI